MITTLIVNTFALSDLYSKAMTNDCAKQMEDGLAIDLIANR